jgi:hypothetical protein
VRRARALCFVPLIILEAGGCKGSTPPEPIGTSSPAGQAPRAAAREGERTARAREEEDALAEVRDRGPMHIPPIHLPARAEVPERWLVVLGAPEMARAAWLVTPGALHDPLRSVEGWPVGVRVVGSIVRDSVAYLLLDSVALLDQPAGMRAVWFDGFGSPSPLTLAPPSALRDVGDLDELARRVDATRAAAAQENASDPPTPAEEDPPYGALMAASKKAAKSEAALAAGISEQGVDFYAEWQATFRKLEERAATERALSTPRGRQIAGLLKDVIKSDRCEGDACEAETDLGRAALRFAPEKGKWAIRAVEREAVPVRGPAPTVAHAVPQTGSLAATKSVLREQVRRTKEILGEAPLQTGPRARGDGSATIGVAVTDLDEGGLAAVLHDGDYARVLPLASLGPVAAELVDERWEARFADVDGDGRTDAVVRGSGRGSDGAPLAFAQVLLTPPASVQGDEMTVDHASDVAVLQATTVDLAVQAALAVPSRGVSVEEACSLLGRLHWTSAKDDLRAIATDDARVLAFDDPSLPTWRARVVPIADVDADDIRQTSLVRAHYDWESGRRCKELVCAPGRPVCWVADGVWAEYFWFAWPGAEGPAAKPKLQAAAFWSGG